MPNYAVDTAPYIAEADKIGGPNVLTRRAGEVGGAVAIELLSLMGIGAAAVTQAAIPVDFQIRTEPLRDLENLDENATYTCLIRDPDDTSGVWTTVNTVATDLQA